MPVVTTSELLPQGGIDLLRGNKLISWVQGRETIATQIEVDGVTYTPAELDVTLQRVLRLPAGCDASSSIESQVREIAEILPGYGLSDDSALLGAAVSTATWAAECVGGMPIVNFFGPPGREVALLNFISAIVRRPLSLHSPSLEEIFALPAGLFPTLILKNPTNEWLRFLLAATTGGARRLRKGRVSIMSCSAIIFTRNPVGVPALRIALGPTENAQRELRPDEADELASRFHPQLLYYRLSHHLDIEKSTFDVGNRFAPLTRTIARKLGATVEGASDLQEQIANALLGIDEQQKVTDSQQPAALVAEGLLVAVHEGRDAIFVGEIADLVSAISRGREDSVMLSAKATGNLLRNDLGLWTKRIGPGCQLLINDAVRRRIHELAQTFGVPSMLHPRNDCQFCMSSRC